MLTIYSIVDNFINKGHVRSVRVKKNILASFFIKGCNIVISLLLVPLTLHYIDAAQYGIWLTLTSVVAWFSFFDIGFGNGLRNKFAEAVARGEHQLARIYLSTTYAVLALIAACSISIFWCVHSLPDWPAIFNAPANFAGDLGKVVLLVFSFFCVQFVLQLITIVVIANQQTAKAAIINLVTNFLSLTLILILTKTTSGNLMYLALALGAAPVVALGIASVWLYNGEYKKYAPALQYVQFSYTRPLMGLGVKFFLIEISGIIIYSTDNIIISQLFGPEEVAPYNIAFKYFNTALIIYAVILSPYWSTITEAFTVGDTGWIKRSMQRLLKVAVLFWLLIIMMVLCSNVVYQWWVGEEVQVPVLLSVLMGIFFCLSLLLQPFTTFINGTGFLKVQLLHSIGAAIINIPLAIFFARVLNMGIAGIILSTIVCFIPGLILTPVQYFKIINSKATGIWMK